VNVLACDKLPLFLRLRRVCFHKAAQSDKYMKTKKSFFFSLPLLYSSRNCDHEYIWAWKKWNIWNL